MSGPIKTLAFISKILYPKYHPFWFLFYMYALYDKFSKRKRFYKLKPVRSDVITFYIKDASHIFNDVNNTVLVHPNNILKSDQKLKLCSKDNKHQKIVYIYPCINCNENELLCGTILINNLISIDFLKDNQFFLQDFLEKQVKFASEINLSLINSSPDITNSVIHATLENYFTTPKLIRKNDLIEINLKDFGEKVFYTNTKIHNVKSVFFKCNNLSIDNKDICVDCYCVLNKTAIKQSANIQSYIPKFTKNFVEADSGIQEIPLCPYGMQSDLEKLERSIKPFLYKKDLNLQPVFLLQGSKGSGKSILIDCLSSSLGMHLCKINNADLAANVYAQTETKLRNALFNAKMAAPCLISITNFENFGKNMEGEYDERLINNFSNELNELFENRTYPILVFCCSNKKELPSNLQRLFLETFNVDAPKDKQREENLRWIMQANSIPYRVDLNEMANKTHGFLFEDLRALVYYAENDADFKNKHNRNDKIQLEDEHFSKALELMQSSYNESLGAPKVPKVQWSDVGGLTDVKNEIIKTINLPLKHPELIKSSGLKRSGILLYGPPGTGKTLIAKAVATECSLCFLSVKGPELLNMYVGQSEENVRDVFERARQASPCIIFFDELDSLAPNRGMSGDSGGVMDRVVSQLLAEMDGLNESATVFIIGATNRPDLIDPALLRPGRFDKLLYIGPCTDPESKASVLKALTRKFILGNDVNVEKVISTCPENITGADLYGICSNAWSSAVRRLINRIEKDAAEDLKSLTHTNVVVNLEDFSEAIKNVKPSISSDDLKYFEKLKKELSVN